MIDLANKTAVFIDMDGTIVDSHPVLLQIYLDFMRRMGVEGSQEEFQELVGPSMPEVVAILRDRYGIDLSVEGLTGQYHQALESVYTNKLRIFDGVVDFLSYAKNKGIKVALVTSATEQLAKKFLQAQGINELFDTIVTPGQGKGKPSPDIYFKALEEVSCEAGDTVVIEDSPNGVQAGVNAGIFTIHIFNTPLPSILEQHPLVAHIGDWHEVMKMCEETHGGI